jgi:hypothetical protein
MCEYTRNRWGWSWCIALGVNHGPPTGRVCRALCVVVGAALSAESTTGSMLEQSGSRSRSSCSSDTYRSSRLTYVFSRSLIPRLFLRHQTSVCTSLPTGEGMCVNANVCLSMIRTCSHRLQKAMVMYSHTIGPSDLFSCSCVESPTCRGQCRQAAEVGRSVACRTGQSSPLRLGRPKS